MKKFVLILSVLFAVSCAHNAKYDKEFKTPKFSQPLPDQEDKSRA